MKHAPRDAPDLIPDERAAWSDLQTQLFSPVMISGTEGDAWLVRTSRCGRSPEVQNERPLKFQSAKFKLGFLYERRHKTFGSTSQLSVSVRAVWRQGGTITRSLRVPVFCFTAV